MPYAYVNVLFLPSLHYAPQESSAIFYLFIFFFVCLSAVKTQLFLFRFLLVAKRPFQMIPSVLMHCCKLTLKRRRILEPRSFLLNCCSGHRKTRKAAVFSCCVACWVIGNCWIRDEMRVTLGKENMLIPGLLFILSSSTFVIIPPSPCVSQPWRDAHFAARANVLCRATICAPSPVWLCSYLHSYPQISSRQPVSASAAAAADTYESLDMLTSKFNLHLAW